MKGFERKYRKENFPVPKLNKGDHVRVKHSYVYIEGTFLFFNFKKTRFRVRLINDVEVWVDVKPYNTHILTRYYNAGNK